jgi:hypothetical protein
MPITSLQAEVTKTAAFNGTGVDISALTGPFEINVTVDALTAASVAHFQIQTSIDNFVSDIRVEKDFVFKGLLSALLAPTAVPSTGTKCPSSATAQAQPKRDSH